MEIRKTQYKDIDRVMQIINQAKQYFVNEKIFQWCEEYPNEDIIKKDINLENSYVIVYEGKIVGVFTLTIGKDEDYEGLNWLTDGEYATINRVAIDNSYKRKGIGNKIIEYSEKYCIENNIYSLRIDTNKLNQPMINLIEKNDFNYIGLVKTSYSSNRLAYEKLLKKDLYE